MKLNVNSVNQVEDVAKCYDGPGRVAFVWTDAFVRKMHFVNSSSHTLLIVSGIRDLLAYYIICCVGLFCIRLKGSTYKGK
jgi:hypothetical protein